MAKHGRWRTLDGHDESGPGGRFSPDGAEPGHRRPGRDDPSLGREIERSRAHDGRPVPLRPGAGVLAGRPDAGLVGPSDGLVSLRDATTGAEVVRLVGHRARAGDCVRT